MRAHTCEYNLRLIYVTWRHIPGDLRELPVDKAISYCLCDGCRRWYPTEQERRYLTQHKVSPPEDYGWSYTGLIYCYEDPEYDRKAQAVANMTPFTAAASIPESSYVWLPPREPQVLAACPYHHIALLRESGEVVAWEPVGY